MLRTITAWFDNPRALVLAGVSGGVLIACFPPVNAGALAWVALVPLLLALDGSRPAAAFRAGFAAGLVFFGGLFYWFIFMASTAQIPLFLSALAAIGIVLYCSLYFGLFAAGAVWLSSRSLIGNVLVISAWWTVLEWTRDRLFTGFGWALLGHTQWLHPDVIQIAEYTGVFGVSFWVAAVNVLIKEIIVRRRGALCRQAVLTALATAAVSAVLIGWGHMKIATSPGGPSMKVALVQGNIAQDVKWDTDAHPLIFEKYLLLTRKAAADKPDLIIWPETAFPGYLWEAPLRLELLKDYVRELGIPLLFGLVRRQDGRYYNSAYLIDAEGKVAVRHNKMHLVPFGEYIPLRRAIPFLEDLIPIEDFSAGREPKLFPVQNGNSFGVLICFEDTVARVARRLVRAGAGVLVNITNDAWFADTRAPLLHLQSAVFRAVEYRRALVRAANTGVTCFIDAAGRMSRSVKDPSGKMTYVTGIVTDEVFFSQQETFYTKFADIFTYLCFGCILGCVIAKKSARKGLRNH